jgi:hypothetical protein
MEVCAWETKIEETRRTKKKHRGVSVEGIREHMLLGEVLNIHVVEVVRPAVISWANCILLGQLDLVVRVPAGVGCK